MAADANQDLLIGSRTGGTANLGSEWDLLVFGGPESYAQRRAANELHRGDVDCLAVVDGDEFQSAWGSRLKSGMLSKWRWDRTGPSEAHYIEAVVALGRRDTRHSSRCFPAHGGPTVFPATSRWAATRTCRSIR
jgi:hypothetical protein